MARKKQLTIAEKRRQELQKLRLSPVKKKSKYTEKEKRLLKREYEKYETILNLEPEEFKTVKVNKSEIKDLRKRGIPVTDTGRAFIDMQGYDSLKITRNKHINEKVIERRTGEKIVHTPISHENILELLKDVDRKNKKLPDGVSVTVQIGEQPFNESYDSYEKLHNYIKYALTPKTDDLGEMIENMNLVYFV